MSGKARKPQWFKVSDTDMMQGRTRAEALRAYNRMKAFEKKGKQHETIRQHNKEKK